MQSRGSQYYAKPPGAMSTTKIVLIVVGSIAGALMLCCIGGGLLLGRQGGMSDLVSCQNLESQGKYKEAIPHCRTVAQRIPQSGIAHNELGWCLALDGQGPEAVAECRKAVELDPNRNHYDSLAMALAVSGKGQEAMQIEKAHVMIDGKITKSQFITLGMVYYSVGEKDKAYRAWEHAKESTNEATRRLAGEFEAKYPSF